MSVTLRGHTFYTDAEVSAMTPSGTIDSQWETYTLTPTGGCSTNWSLNRFHVNKITGLVTGEIGLKEINKQTGQLVGTNSNLAIHSGMRIKYTGNWEYGATQTTASESFRTIYKQLNGCWNTSGAFSLQGAPWSSTNIQYLSTFLETHAYIGSKYGKITTTDVKDPIYLDEGAFYDANTVDLITGHAWLRIDVTLPTGYKSGSFLTFYKNLWSGEIIMQYLLYPTTPTTIYLPTITIPSRVNPIENRVIISDIRYEEGATVAAQRQNMFLYLPGDNTVKFYGGGQGSTSSGAITRVDGSFYYPGTPEVRSQNVSYETQALFVPESSSPISSAQSNKFPSATTGIYAWGSGVNQWMNSTYYKGRSVSPNWVWRSLRTGMVFVYLDMQLVKAELPSDNVLSAQTSGNHWGPEYCPSYRYNATSGTIQPLYFSGAGFLQYRKTDAVPYDEYSCNICMYTGKSLGTHDTTQVNYGYLCYGTPGQYKEQTNNLTCFTGYYLGNWAGNIVK